MELTRLKRSAWSAFIVSTFVLCAGLFIYAIIRSDGQDFHVFYYSARNALEGKSIYALFGKSHLPFWYFPWTAWVYIPLAIFPLGIAISIYSFVSVLSAILVIHNLTNYYDPSFIFQNKVFIFALIIPMSVLLVFVGQMDYILLGLIVVMMYAIDRKKDILAGVLFPILWMKPHLLVIFTLFAFWRAGKRTILISLGLSAIMFLIETAITPGWPSQMLHLLGIGTQRTEYIWNFTTLPTLLGSQENWAGTANLPFTLLLMAFAVLIVWKFRSLPTIPLLSLALAASLFCAPRSYAYDLPMLIPLMIWLTAKEFKSTFWIWIAAATIPILADYSSGAYLLTVLVFFLGIRKAYNLLSQSSLVQEKQLQ